MNCANLLSFIQIAVTFNFGLLCLKDFHVFKSLHSDFLEEMKTGVKSTLEEGDKLYEENKYKSGPSIRACRAELKDCLNQLYSAVDTNKANWGKYSYLGLYSGVYGLICLLAIGIFGIADNSFDSQIKDFLLIITEIFLVLEVSAIFQVTDLTGGKAATKKIFRKLAILLGFVIIALIAVPLGLYFKCFDNFEWPFIIGVIAVLYLPVFIYVWKVVYAWGKIKTLNRKCNKAINGLQGIIGNPSANK